MSKVTALAFDLRNGTNGELYTFEEGKIIELYITMEAPSAMPESEYAYNQPAYYSTQQTQTGATSTTHFNISDRTKVSLGTLQTIRFTKLGESNDVDEDGNAVYKPIGGAEFTLYQCTNTDAEHTHSTRDVSGCTWEQTRQTYSLADGSVSFRNLDTGVYKLVESKAATGYQYLDYNWSVEASTRYWIYEVDAKKGTVSVPVAYTTSKNLAAVPMENDENGGWTLKNGRIKMDGRVVKYLTEDSEGIIRPDSITFDLYRNGVLIDTKTLEINNSTYVTPWRGGTGFYLGILFEDLFKYDEGGDEYTYEVKERVPVGYENYFKTDYNDNGDKVFQVSNRRLGLLDVTKLAPAAKDDEAFTFTVTLKDAYGNAIANKDADGNDVTYTLRLISGETSTDSPITLQEGGILSFSLKRDQTARLIGLPLGATYSVAESDAAGYTSEITFGSAKGTLSSTTNPSVTFTNTPIPPATGSIEISKTVTDTDYAEYEGHEDDWFSFTVYLKDADGNTLTGEYPYAIYNSDGTVSDSGKITPADNHTAISFTAGQKAIITDIPDGTNYQVYEVQPANKEYTYGSSVNGNEGPSVKGTIVGGETATAAYSNAFLPRTSVSVTKTWVDGNDKNGKRPTSITLNLMAKKSADGETEKVKSATVTPDTDGNWTYTFDYLDKYEGDFEIQYSVEEEAVTDYSSAVTGDAASGYTITNTLLTSVSGTKTWYDGDSASRPTSITVNLLANGTKTDKTATLNAAGEWKYSFTGLAKYDADGKEITYTVTEDAVDGYKTVINGNDITNILLTTISGKKTWNDADDQDGKRPDSITIRLLADGKEVNNKTVTETDVWAWTFADLPVYTETGTEIVYTVTEDAVTDYTSAVDGCNVTNSYTPGTTDVRVTKAWVDGGNADSTRPESVTVKLLADGKDTGKTLTLNADNKWTGSFENLDVMASKKAITYTIEEVSVEGYSSAVTGDMTKGFTITNTELTEVSVTKTWVDGNDADTKRPESVTVTLKANGTATDKTATLNAAGEWTYSFTGLAKYDADGNEITYSVSEDAVDGYGSAVTGDAASGYNITNTLLTSVSGTKTWYDGDSASRPKEITVNLLTNGKKTDSKTVSADDSGSWTYSFTGLAKYDADGKEITYTVTEDAVDGYKTVINGNDITNILLTTISGSKTWNDANDRDGKRPDSITIRLKADGTEVNNKTVTETDVWAWSFANLPVYTESGTAISYTVTEDSVTDYTSTVNGYNVTNSYTPGTTNVRVTKAWVDGNNADSTRPESVTVKLLADGKDTGKTLTLNANNNWSGSFENLDAMANKKAITYTIEEVSVDGYSSAVTGDMTKGFTITNTELTEVSVTKTWVDGNNADTKRPTSITVNLLANGTATDKTATLNAAGEWKYSFTGLAKYDADGNEITYSVSEDTVDGYSSAVTGDAASGYTITNTLLTSVSGTKTWYDGDSASRPTSITVNLLANGAKTDKTATLNAAGEWKYSFTGLAKYDADGKEITYTVSEDAVKGYKTVINGNDITNILLTTISGSKTWNDANDQDGKRPDSITIRLFADGTEKDVKTVTEKDGWKWSFTDLPVYTETGTAIVYAVTEDSVTDYTSAVDGYNVTNSYTPGTTDVSVTKAWVDGNNADSTRPESITVKLLADGKDTGKTLTLNADNKWTGSFENLDVMASKKAITYTIEEVSVEGYSSAVTGDMTKGFTITNTELTEVSVTKTWVDGNDADTKRPESVTVTLKANGTATDKTATLNAAGEWKYSFTGLAKYDAEGNAIEYSVEEVSVTGYSSEITGDAGNGYTITNTLLTSVSGTKTWYDGDSASRPTSITVNLLADGEKQKSVTVTAAGEWKYSFTGLAKYDADGKEITYTVTEDAVDGYKTVINGNDITNILLTTISGSKTWNDANDQDGKRPTSITIRLLADGKEVNNKTVTEKDGWKWSFTDLPVYTETGTAIVYAVTEDAVTDYTSNVDGYNVTNSYTPGKVSIYVTKCWQDGGNADKIRPNVVTIRLLADGKETGTSLTLNAGCNWTGCFTDLDEYQNGQKIVYTVEENWIFGYSRVITGDMTTGFVVTNSHTPILVPITGDDSNVALWSALAGLSATGLAGAVTAMRRKKRKSEAGK